jgi:FkbM family methyltransferase
MLKSDITDFEGSKMYLNKLFREVSHLGVWEKQETEIIKKIVNQGDVVLDIGANIGYFTLLFSRLVGPSGKVYSFEPEPENFSLLKKNVELNNYKNIILIQKAVSNENRKIKLFLSMNNEGDHQIYDSGENRNFIEIDSIRLDDYFKNFEKKINFIKMDIQGAECKAIEGMQNILEKNNQLKLITEYWPYGLINFDDEPLAFPKLLLGKKYHPYDLNEKYNETSLTNLDELEQRYEKKIGSYTNLLWSKDFLDTKRFSLK